MPEYQLKIKYGTVWLSESVLEAPAEFSLSAKWTAQIAPLLRSDAVRVFGRGNREMSASFRVARIHPSPLAAQTFLFTHPASLPKSATAIFTFADGSTITMENAVCTTLEQQTQGIRTLHRYLILGGSFTSQLNPLPTEVPTVYGGTINLSNGATTATISGLALPVSAKRPSATVRKPNAQGANIWATVRNDSISTDGFVFDLSAAPDSDLYQLDYQYFL